MQFAREALGTQVSLCGRAEHVVSGHAIHFETLDELLSFIQAELTGQREPGESA